MKCRHGNTPAAQDPSTCDARAGMSSMPVTRRLWTLLALAALHLAACQTLPPAPLPTKPTALWSNAFAAVVSLESDLNETQVRISALTQRATSLHLPAYSPCAYSPPMQHRKPDLTTVPVAQALNRIAPSQQVVLENALRSQYTAAGYAVDIINVQGCINASFVPRSDGIVPSTLSELSLAMAARKLHHNSLHACL